MRVRLQRHPRLADGRLVVAPLQVDEREVVVGPVERRVERQRLPVRLSRLLVLAQAEVGVPQAVQEVGVLVVQGKGPLIRREGLLALPHGVERVSEQLVQVAVVLPADERLLEDGLRLLELGLAVQGEGEVEEPPDLGLSLGEAPLVLRGALLDRPGAPLHALEELVQPVLLGLPVAGALELLDRLLVPLQLEKDPAPELGEPRVVRVPPGRLGHRVEGALHVAAPHLLDAELHRQLLVGGLLRDLGLHLLEHGARLLDLLAGALVEGIQVLEGAAEVDRLLVLVRGVGNPSAFQELVGEEAVGLPLLRLVPEGEVGEPLGGGAVSDGGVRRRELRGGVSGVISEVPGFLVGLEGAVRPALLLFDLAEELPALAVLRGALEDAFEGIFGEGVVFHPDVDVGDGEEEVAIGRRDAVGAVEQAQGGNEVPCRDGLRRLLDPLPDLFFFAHRRTHTPAGSAFG